MRTDVAGWRRVGGRERELSPAIPTLGGFFSRFLVSCGIGDVILLPLPPLPAFKSGKSACRSSEGVKTRGRR